MTKVKFIQSLSFGLDCTGGVWYDNYFIYEEYYEYFDPDYYEEVLQFDVGSLTWKNISTLKQGRYEHAMAVVKMEDIIDQCVNR